MGDEGVISQRVSIPVTSRKALLNLALLRRRERSVFYASRNLECDNL